MTTEPRSLEMSNTDFEALLLRLEQDELTDIDRGHIKELLSAFAWMGESLEKSELSIQRMKRLFGIKTEKSKSLFPETAENQPSSSPTKRDRNEHSEPKGKGHKAAIDYPGAEKIFYPHETLRVGQVCPACGVGTIFRYGVASILRLFGQPPVAAVVHQPEQLRCSACGTLFTAKIPTDVAQDRNEPTAKAMVAMLRYGSGMPFYRLEKLQEMFQVPLPDSTQWDMSEELANDLNPIFKALVRLAGAKGELYYADDTTGRVIQLKKKLDATGAKRTGIFTTGIITETYADGDEPSRQIALFFTGNQHAGENMASVLRLRPPGLAPPMVMSDALSSNNPKGVDLKINRGSCMDHARREFVDLKTKYEEESKYLIFELKSIYATDRAAKTISKAERLKLHQEKSGPVMERIKAWCEKNLNEKLVEPNGPLGGAMQYILNHFERLTMFLKIEGMPIANSEVERLLKTSVLHRKNSMFYQTETGAAVGDIHMSVIQTARRADVNVFDYLTAVQNHRLQVRANPEAWFPWNYHEQLPVDRLLN